MHLRRYMSFLATHRSFHLGIFERRVLFEYLKNKQLTTYTIFKTFKKDKWNTPVAYKNIHKRVKRLEQMGLIRLADAKLERGAKPYQITSNGLLYFLSTTVLKDELASSILDNKDSIIIESIFLKYFEEETINACFTHDGIKDYHLRNYLFDCCSDSRKVCFEITELIQKYKLQDILPSDEIIQRYIIYLDDGPVDDDVLEEINKYKTKLADKLEDIREKMVDTDFNYNYYLKYRKNHPERFDESVINVSRINEEPPFPFNYMYVLLAELDYSLYEKLRSYTLLSISTIGEIAVASRISTIKDLQYMLDYFERNNNHFLTRILKDRKFHTVMTGMYDEFVTGFKQFAYFH